MQTNPRRTCRTLRLLTTVVCLGAVTLPGAGWGGPNKEAGRETAAKVQRPTFPMPKFTPPKRGAPVGRIAGGARGQIDGLPTLAALVPDHLALTALESPTVYWYTSEVPNWPVELTVTEPWAETPLLVRDLPRPAAPGIQRVRLDELGGRLQPDRDYRWYVAVVRDPESRSQDLLAFGGVRWEPPSPELMASVERVNPEDLPSEYAAAGYWYEALDAAMVLAGSGSNHAGDAARDSLLSQVGLGELVGAGVTE